MNKNFIFTSCLLLMLASCSKHSTPEEALKSFIKYRFNSSQSKSDLVEMTSGEFREFINSMEEEDFARFSETKLFKHKKFKILYKNCEDKGKCFITYLTGYEQNNDSNKYYVEVRKMAELVNEEGKWLVSDVSDIKSYIEGKTILNE